MKPYLTAHELDHLRHELNASWDVIQYCEEVKRQAITDTFRETTQIIVSEFDKSLVGL